MKTYIVKKRGLLILFAILTILAVSITAQFHAIVTALSADIARYLEAVAYASEKEAEYYASYEVYAFYDPKETIVLFNDQDDPNSPLYVSDPEEPYDGAGYRANYPEIAFVTFVAFKKDAEGRYSIYEGGDGEITVQMKLKKTGKNNNRSEYIDNELPYQLIDLNEEGFYLSNIDAALSEDELSRGIVDWKGFFLALDSGNGEGIRSLKEALAQTNEYSGMRPVDGRPWPFQRLRIDAPRNDIQISMGEAGMPVCVIAVKSWNGFDKPLGNIDFSLGYRIDTPGDLPVDIVTVKAGNPAIKRKIDIDVDVNNVKLVRENIQRHIDGGGGISDFIPDAGRTYTMDPGPFVVKGMINKRPYNKIIEILVDAANGREGYPSAFTDKDQPDPNLGIIGDTDWLEVAAADIYGHPDDNTEKVFKCVWEIKTFSASKYRGCVYPSLPFRVYLYPFAFHSNSKTRFNGSLRDAYEFIVAKKRDGTIFHESLHCYHDLHGEGVYDNERPPWWNTRWDPSSFFWCLGDKLYVGECDEKNPYLTFSYDHEKRGFLSPRFREGIVDSVGDYLYGEYGSEHYYKRRMYWKDRAKKDRWTKWNKGGHFITRIDDGLGEIFNGQAPITIESDIPDDLPYRKKYYVTGVYLYKPPPAPAGVGKWRLLNNENQWIKIHDDGQRRQIENYGYRFSYKYDICITPPYEPREGTPSRKDCLKMLEQGYHLYVTYSILYHKNPCEYDAAKFEITHAPKYTVIVNSGSGSGDYYKGEVVIITADAAPANRHFDQWTGDIANIADIHASTTTITMPAGAVTITATYASGE